MRTAPSCSIFTHRPSSGAKPKPSLPITAPLCTTQRSPRRQPSPTTTRGASRVCAPITAPRPTRHCAPTIAPAPISALSPTQASAPTDAPGCTRQPCSSTALGCTPGVGAGRVRAAHHCVRRAKYRYGSAVAMVATPDATRSRSAGVTITQAARVSASCAR